MMQFDARTAKLLAPGSHITIDGFPGLRLNATSSSRTWLYRYKSPVDGRMRQVKLGAWPAMSPAAAIVEWERLREIRDGGGDPAAEKRAGRAEVRKAAELDRVAKHAAAFTVRKACDLYWTGHVERHRKKKGAAEIRRMFDTMLGDFGMLPAADITRSQAFDLLESFSHIPVQSANLRAELGAAWDYNLDSGKLPESTPNWWRQIMRGRLRSKGKKIEGKSIGTVKRHLSDQELAELIPWLPNFSRTVADVLTLYLWTCTRGAEIVSMAGSEISEESDVLWWTIPKEKTKNARHENATDLRVPLIGRAAVIVRRRLLLAGDGPLFPANTEDGHAQQQLVQTSVYFHQPYSATRPEQLRPRLTVTRWAPHDLRRTSRTLLASMGCPDPVGEAILGHMQPGVRGIYNRHAYDAERLVWLTRLSDRLEQIVTS
jgi:integrase